MIQTMLLLGSLMGATAVAPQSADTLEVNKKVRDRLGQYYYTAGQWKDRSREEIGEWLGWECSGDDGAECFGGDWSRSPCPSDVACQPSADGLLELLLESSEAHPESGFVLGQTVFALVKFGRHIEAMEIVEDCEASEWWCEALRGHVFQGVGRVAEAEASFRRFVEGAPDAALCAFGDGTWLLGPWSVRESWLIPPRTWEEQWSEETCEVRRAASDTVWWLSDPLYIAEGNDRWAEQVDRELKSLWDLEIQDAGPFSNWRGPARDFVRARVIRRGPYDAFEYFPTSRSRGQTGNFWTSLKAARYHFVPDFDGEGFGNPTWRLMGTLEDEGYTPPYAPFYEVQVQIARFRGSEGAGGGRQRIATATSAENTPIFETVESAYLVMTDAPESFPLQLNAPFNEGRAVFLAEAEAKPYVTSVEILTEAGIGWHREMLVPLAAEGLGLSDLLLFEPKGFTLPDSLLPAASMMLPTTELAQGDEVGVYWELYGVPPDTPVTFELELRREDGGLVDRLRRLLPGGAEEGSGRLAWTEPATGEVFPKAILLGLGGEASGSYTMVLRASWEGAEGVETTRAYRVR